MNMRINLLPSTRMGLQAATAVFIATLLGYTLPIERPYWAILTAMVLVSQTFGESIKKSFERILMTILGGIVGTMIYFYFKNYPLILFCLTLATVFLIIYFIEISYLVSMFFLTVFVVFLFASIQGWSTHLLLTRIYETFIGAAIALISTAVIFPIRVHHRYQDRLSDFLNLLNQSVNMSLDFPFQHLEQSALRIQQANVLAAFLDLKKDAALMRYETLFKPYPKQRLDQLASNIDLLLHYTTSSLQTVMPVSKIHDKIVIQADFEKIKDAFNHNFSNLILLFKEKDHEALVDIEPIRQEIRLKLMQLVQTKEQKMAWFSIHSFMYFLVRLNDVMLEIAKVVK